jgi:protein tyrosine/serine phosphatase
MISRFHTVVPGKLYRGSGPTPKDVIDLHKHLGIHKIISLDAGAGQKIDRIAKLLGIKHIIIPLNGTDLGPVAELFSYDLKDLLLSDGPTYVHCIHGKDRTGLVIAMFKCKYMGVSCDKAIKEAKHIGFGVYMDPKTTAFYEKIIRMFCGCNHQHQADDNDADIVDNSRPNADWRGSYLDAADMSSFAPYLDYTRQWPYNPVYDYKYDQYPTRRNIDLEKCSPEEGKQDQIPMVGLYDNDAGVHGTGGVDVGGGFVQV